MDILVIIGVIAAIFGIPAAIVQVLDYLQKRREKRDELSEEGQPSSLLTVPQVPHNLPPRSEFIGREREKARVHEALQSRSYLVSIDGIGGIGKTVLALEAAHECLRASKGKEPTDGIATFNGFIWTTAKDRDLALNDLLDAVARTLEYPGIAQQPIGEKRDAVRKLLQEKPYLVIVDNFETITDEGVRDFLFQTTSSSQSSFSNRFVEKLRILTDCVPPWTPFEAPGSTIFPPHLTGMALVGCHPTPSHPMTWHNCAPTSLSRSLPISG